MKAMLELAIVGVYVRASWSWEFMLELTLELFQVLELVLAYELFSSPS